MNGDKGTILFCIFSYQPDKTRLMIAKIANILRDLVGNTPLMELSGYSGKYGLNQNIIAKLEAFNPAGSVKDRVALSMIEDMCLINI